MTFGDAFLDDWQKLANFMGRNSPEPITHDVPVKKEVAPDMHAVESKNLNADLDGNYLDPGGLGVVRRRTEPPADDIAPDTTDVRRRDIGGSHAGMDRG